MDLPCFWVIGFLESFQSWNNVGERAYELAQLTKWRAKKTCGHCRKRKSAYGLHQSLARSRHAYNATHVTCCLFTSSWRTGSCEPSWFAQQIVDALHAKGGRCDLRLFAQLTRTVRICEAMPLQKALQNPLLRPMCPLLPMKLLPSYAQTFQSDDGKVGKESNQWNV